MYNTVVYGVRIPENDPEKGYKERVWPDENMKVYLSEHKSFEKTEVEIIKNNIKKLIADIIEVETVKSVFVITRLIDIL